MKDCECNAYHTCFECRKEWAARPEVNLDELVAEVFPAPSCSKCGHTMEHTATLRLKCKVCEERALTQNAMTMGEMLRVSNEQFANRLNDQPGLNSGQPECTDWQQKEYRVTWCIDVSADSPEDAVRQVWEQYFLHGHTATVFEVKEFDALDSEMIDVESPL